jgi:hypothetical protein
MEQTFTHDSELKGTLTRLIPSWTDVAKAGRCLGQADGETLKGLGRVHDTKSGPSKRKLLSCFECGLCTCFRERQAMLTVATYA